MKKNKEEGFAKAKTIKVVFTRKNKEELKTLKDFDVWNTIFKDENGISTPHPFIDSDELKAEAIKWIKEDIKEVVKKKIQSWVIVKRWMDRLNITEEELFEEKE